MSKQDIQKAVKEAVAKMPHGKDIRRVRLFGSHLHGDAKPTSDVDLIVDFDEAAIISLFDLVDIEDFFRQALQSEVDIVTAKGLKRYIRDKVLNEAETLYERKG
ncbi:MAG: nucleotidyltransferase domain-containing protein [Candidatus Portnoybacteria bacterium]|nr:nucleotidyltransferase domain-containing protein [Candidatus Portnoybacteria bacterium]